MGIAIREMAIAYLNNYKDGVHLLKHSEERVGRVCHRHGTRGR